VLERKPIVADYFSGLHLNDEGATIVAMADEPQNQNKSRGLSLMTENEGAFFHFTICNQCREKVFAIRIKRRLARHKVSN
jgi:hypothetical protein